MNFLFNLFSLTKPGIIVGNIVTVLAGFFMANPERIDVGLFAATFLGISLVMASGCVFNNIIDRDIDALMERTRKRALPQGLVELWVAFFFGVVLGVLGSVILFVYTNKITFAVAILGFFVYVVLYSLYVKRAQPIAILVGGVAGAVPPLVGYLAVRGTFDSGAVIIFALLLTWQLPHALAISLRRVDDYIAAHIPVIPVRAGIESSKFFMLVFVVLFVLSTLPFVIFGFIDFWYFVPVLLVNTAWVFFAARGVSTNNNSAWARAMFIFSIVSITLISFMIVLSWVA